MKAELLIKNKKLKTSILIRNNYISKFIETIAKKNEIPFIWNEKFPINSLYLMRGYLCIEEEKKDKFIDICFDAYWKNNLDISEEKILKQK